MWVPHLLNARFTRYLGLPSYLHYRALHALPGGASFDSILDGKLYLNAIQQAQEVHAAIRAWMGEKVSPAVAEVCERDRGPVHILP